VTDPACRPGTAVAASLVIGLAIALALRGVARSDGQTSGGAGAPLLGSRLRAWYRALLAPFEDELVARGVPADVLTYGQLVVSVVAGAAFATGALFAAGWLTIFAGTLDVLDGGVARRSGKASARGALIDSVIDRHAEFAIFAGLGVFFGAGWMLLLVALAAFESQMVSYTRARAEGLGLEMHSGRAQRPERFVVLGFGGWVSSLVAHLGCPLFGRPTHVVLATAVVLLVALSTWTASERLWTAAAALRGKPPQ
jgi:CDP-diacylglycerol---glycerol-3-phosphate 3-phosphatidyltransferase